MNKLRTIFIWVAILFAIFHCKTKVLAQSPVNYVYKLYNSSDGLPSSEIISLAKDVNGFLWVGTAVGISRYDGYEFQNFSTSTDNDVIGYVNKIVAGKNGELWIGSDAGLFCLVNNQIIRISRESILPQGVNDIHLLNNDSIWLATENGPAKIKVDNEMMKGVKKIRLEDFVLPQWKFTNDLIDNRRVKLISIAPDGAVYFAQDDNLFQLKGDEVVLLHHVEMKQDFISSLFPISANKIFYNAIETEIHLLDNGVHTNIQHKQLYSKNYVETKPGVWYQGAIGMYYFHPGLLIASQFINTSSMGANWATTMLKDESCFWVGSHEGLLKIKPSIYKVYDAAAVFPLHQDYYSILQLANGEMLLGSNRGNIISHSKGEFSRSSKSIKTPAEVKAIYEDERGWLWIGSGYRGLFLKANQIERNFTAADGLHDNSFAQFLKTKNGELYAIGDQGITEIIISNNNQISFRKFYSEPHISKHAKFFAGVDAPNGDIWIVGEEGILRQSGDSLSRVVIDERQVAVKDIIKDRNDAIWVATNGEGIWKCRFDRESNLHLEKKYTEADGLNTMYFMCLLADQNNNIWAGSSLGLSFIGADQSKNSSLLNFDASDGFLQPGYYSIRLSQDKAGIIWAVTSNGFASFNPNELFLSVAAPKMFITSVRSIKTNSIVSNDGPDRKFAYNDNSFNFNFVALDYSNQSSIRYFYRLEGLDSGWVSAGNLRSVTYGNLQPNTYFFRVKAINNKGIVSEKEAVYTFTIALPFWRTWWFIMAVIGIVTLTTIWLFRRRIAMIKAKAAISQQMANLETRSLRSQMNPHFIFNSLNSISQLVASQRNEEGLQYLTKFSKLLRLVLEESENSFLSIKDEIKILDLYLQLESLRFGGSFFYNFQIDDDIDEEETLLPSFLLHPVIENAIWHGLLHKTGERRLIVNFQLKDKTHLLCVVKDNGIGIEEAFHRKQQVINGEKRESKGVRMVRDRLRLIEEQHNITTDFLMEDMRDEQGYISGTKVTIQLPLLHE